MKQILLATDFSDSCDNALTYAIGLLENTDLTLDLVHIFDISVIATGNIPARGFSDLLSARTRAVEGQLEEINQLIPSKHRGSIKAIYGPYAANEIAEYAKGKSYDLIIMALRQKYSLMDRIIGTVTAQTIHLSDVPILAIPSGASFVGLRKILFPTSIEDLEEMTAKEEKAIKWLSEFCKTLDVAKIHMVHIQEGRESATLNTTYEHKPFDHMEFTLSAAESIEDGIIRFSGKEQADLLAFYKPRRHFWEQLYRSSLTRKMLFKSRTPLLLFN